MTDRARDLSFTSKNVFSPPPPPSPRRSRWLGQALFLCAALAGCAGEPSFAENDDDSDVPTLVRPAQAQTEAVLGRVVVHAADGARLVRLTETPVPSAVAAGRSFDLWIDERAVEAYTKLSGDDDGAKQNVRLPVGSVVVRALMSDGAFTAITALVQGPPASNPPSDLWFAEYDAEGNLRTEADGRPRQGAIDTCSGCHNSRADNGYVFGLP